MKEELYSTWTQLPNYIYIKQLVNSLKEHITYWEEVDPGLDVYGGNLSYSRAYDQAWYKSYYDLRTSVRIEIYGMIHAAVGESNPMRDNAYVVARDASLAFIAYDDANKYLELTPEKLKMIIALTEHPAAILLYQTVVVLDKIRKDLLNENQLK